VLRPFSECINAKDGGAAGFSEVSEFACWSTLRTGG